MGITDRLNASFARGLAPDGDPDPMPKRTPAMKTKPMVRKKQEPIPVRIVNEPIDTSVAPNKEAERKPTLRLNLGASAKLPAYGTRVKITVTGKVLNTESGVKSWDRKQKPKAHVEIEYDGPSAVKVQTVGLTPDEIDAADDAMEM